MNFCDDVTTFCDDVTSFGNTDTLHYDVKGRGCITVSTVLILSRFS